MANPFTIRIYVPDGDPEGVRIIDRLSSTGTFFSFPRNKWAEIKQRSEFENAGIYILTGYTNSEDELPTVYIGQADTIRNRIDQHTKGKDFWDKAVVFVTSNLNATHAKWLEYALIQRAREVNRSLLENGNAPQEPTISEPERAEMQVFLNEIYQTLPLVGLMAFEPPRTVQQSDAEPNQTNNNADNKDTIVVPANKDGFERVFLGEDSWYAIRIAGGMLDKIKYIASYQTQPISAVTHYAPIERIEPYGENGKYKLVFSEPATKIETPIVLGDATRGMMQGSRYTSFERLRIAKNISELF